jgi:hypothetical protein
MAIIASKRQKIIKIGDRVCYSDFGRERLRFPANRVGTVIGYPQAARALSGRVDGNKASLPVRMDYLQHVSDK